MTLYFLFILFQAYGFVVLKHYDGQYSFGLIIPLSNKPRIVAPNINSITSVNAIPITISIRVAFAQFDFEMGIFELNAQTKSIINPTNGIAVMSNVISQSLNERLSLPVVSTASIMVFD